jgi:hypothetical protein
MTRKIRVALLSGAVLASLALAGSALAAFTPKLVVGSQSAATRVGVVVGSADDPTAKVDIYLPAGYQLAAPAAGTKLGDVTATAAAGDLGGAVLPLTGELDAISQSAFTASQQASAKQCLGGQTASQTWDLHLTAAGQTLDIPVFVLAGAAPELASGYQAKLRVCLPPPDVPAGTPGRATFGAKLLSATFTSSAITEPSAAGDFRWTSLWTPYNPGKGTVNAAGTVEAQSLRHLPVTLSTTVTKKKLTTYKTKRVNGKKHRVRIVRTLVRVSSRATENGAPASSAAISTRAGSKRIGGASGSFILASGKSATVTATAAIDSDSGAVPTGQTAGPGDLFFHDLGASACIKTAIFQGLPCIDATVGGEKLSRVARVKGYR